MAEKRNKFYLGIGLLIGFLIVLLFFFLPFFDGKNGLDYMDTLYNSISKGSAYYIPELKKDIDRLRNHPVSASLQLFSEEEAAQTALLFKAGGATVNVSGKNLQISGDLGLVLENALADSDAMYWNKGQDLSGKYGYRERKVLFNWWKALNEMQKSLNQDKKFEEAKTLAIVQKKAVETSYNYYTIEPERIGDRWGAVVFSLLFYIVYTLWYGFAILFLFEGWGLRIGH